MFIKDQHDVNEFALCYRLAMDELYLEQTPRIPNPDLLCLLFDY